MELPCIFVQGGLVMRKEIVISALSVLAVLLSACGAAATPTPAAPTAMPAADTPMPATDTAMPAAPTVAAATDTVMPPAVPAAAANLMTQQSATLGDYLVDSNGMTLYIYTKDQPGTSTCYNGCATNWPPLLTNGAPVAGTGVTASMLGTTQRTDGSTQVTYNGWPLYYFVADKAAGDTNGEGKGGVWYVMTPAGTQK